MKTSKPRPMARYALVRNTLPVDVPEGWPSTNGEVLAEVVKIHDGAFPSVLESLWDPGCGYSAHFSVLDIVPRRRLSETTKQGIRRKALVRHMEKNAPLFADAFIAERLAAQPEYFGLDTQ